MRFVNKGKKIEVKKTLLPAGDYRAEIKDVKLNTEVTSKYGTGSTLEITYELQDKEGRISVEKTDSVWCNQHPNSRCTRLLNALYDGNPPEDMDTNDWLGRCGWVEIKHNTKQNNNQNNKETYANIDNWDFSDCNESEDEFDGDEYEEDAEDDEMEEEISFDEEDAE